ncbi:MAG: hypothetical protein ACOC3I_06720, partial [Verrucomicrobiota bacterium]
MQAKVKESVAVNDSASRNLNAINESVTTAPGRVKEISTASRQQSDGIEQVNAALKKCRSDPRIVSLVPRGAEGMFETALEAASIQSLLKDTSLAAEDPLVVPELQQMLDDTQAYLMRVLDKMYSPSPDGPVVLSEGSITMVGSRREFRQFLSTQIR